MGWKEYELTGEQSDRVHVGMDRVVHLSLVYITGEFSRDAFFEEYAMSFIAMGETSSWADDAIHLALPETFKKYADLTIGRAGRGRADYGIDHREADIRGSILMAGGILLAANNKLMDPDKIERALEDAHALLAHADAELHKLGALRATG